MSALSAPIVRLAARNVARNPRRSGLSALAIGLCVAFVWVATALTVGMMERTVERATQGVLGHVQVHHAEYRDDPRPARTLPETALKVIEAHPGVLSAAPRVYASAFARAGTRSAGIMIVGIDPAREAKTSGLEDELDAGNYLGGEVQNPHQNRALVGHGLAEFLDLDLGDELDLSVQAIDGTPRVAKLAISGIFRTGSVELDDTAVFAELSEVQSLAGFEHQLHEISVQGEDVAKAGVLAKGIGDALRAEKHAGLESADWRTIVPDIALFVDMAEGTFAMFAFVLVLAVGAAILLTQSMVVFERRHELALLRAIGLKPNQMLRLLVYESTLLAGLGALAGLALGAIALAVLAQTGLDLGGGGADMEFAGMAVSTLLYPSVDLVVPLEALLTSMFLAAFASVLAALRSARRSPLEVLRDAG